MTPFERIEEILSGAAVWVVTASVAGLFWCFRTFLTDRARLDMLEKAHLKADRERDEFRKEVKDDFNRMNDKLDNIRNQQR